jgi:hypothetical protein
VREKKRERKREREREREIMWSRVCVQMCIQRSCRRRGHVFRLRGKKLSVCVKPIRAELRKKCPLNLPEGCIVLLKRKKIARAEGPDSFLFKFALFWKRRRRSC